MRPTRGHDQRSAAAEKGVNLTALWDYLTNRAARAQTQLGVIAVIMAGALVIGHLAGKPELATTAERLLYMILAAFLAILERDRP